MTTQTCRGGLLLWRHLLARASEQHIRIAYSSTTVQTGHIFLDRNPPFPPRATCAAGTMGWRMPTQCLCWHVVLCSAPGRASIRQHLEVHGLLNRDSDNVASARAHLAAELVQEAAHVGRGPGLLGLQAQALRLEAARSLRRIQRGHALLQPRTRPPRPCRTPLKDLGSDAPAPIERFRV